MDSSSSSTEIAHDFRPFFRVYKDGRVERYMSIKTVPPSDEPEIGFRCKDVVISSEPAVTARVFIPLITDRNKKLPLLLYVHGGRFSSGSAFLPGYHKFIGSLVDLGNILAVSIEYRLAPEHLIPACYNDSWAALEWVANHANRDGAEPWLNDYTDFDRVFLVGDSSGANICHYLVSRLGSIGLSGMKVMGMALVHPFFAGEDEREMLTYMCRETIGLEDSRLVPVIEDLGKLGCERVLVFVAEKDGLRERGIDYVENLKKSGWKGTVEIVEDEGESHVFHLDKPNSKKANHMKQKLVSFINHDPADL